MTDPTHVLIFAALVLALLTAMAIPPPAEPADDHASGPLLLLGAGCVAAIAMGILALLGRPAQSAVCGAVAWLLTMPCVWLARAPRPAGEWRDEAEDDDGGGSPPPHPPSAPPAPDDRLPGLRPPAAPAAGLPWTAPRSAPIVATAAKVKRMLAAQEAERAAAAAAPAVFPTTARFAPPATPVPPRPAAPVAPPPAAAPPQPLEIPQPQRRPAAVPRVRPDDRCTEAVAAAGPHAGRRRRAHVARLLARRGRRWRWTLVRDRCERRRQAARAPRV